MAAYFFYVALLEMRTIAFGLKQATAFQNKHTHCKQDESNAPPVDFFHSGKIFFTFTKANVGKRFSVSKILT